MVADDTIDAGAREWLVSIADDLQAEVIPGTRVKILFTDDYERTVHSYAHREAVQMDPDHRPEYEADRRDGSRAGGKTMYLESGDCVVVFSKFGLLMEPASVRRALLHEMQHVRIAVRGEHTWGCHRAGHFEKPFDLPWHVIWIAENMLEEFRCERELWKRGALSSSLETRVGDADVRGIASVLSAAASDYRRPEDLLMLMQVTYESLDRAAYLFAHDAAHACVVGTRKSLARRWKGLVGAEQVDTIANELQNLKPSGETCDMVDVRLSVLELGRGLTFWLKHMGFDHEIRADGSQFFWLR